MRGATDFTQMTDISKDLRGEFAANFTLKRPNIVTEQVSVDGTRKWLLRLEDGKEIETVYNDANLTVTETDKRNLVKVTQLDALGRLVSVTRSGVVLEQHEYDGNGNRTLSTDANGNAVRYMKAGCYTYGLREPDEARLFELVPPQLLAETKAAFPGGMESEESTLNRDLIWWSMRKVKPSPLFQEAGRPRPTFTPSVSRIALCG